MQRWGWKFCLLIQPLLLEGSFYVSACDSNFSSDNTDPLLRDEATPRLSPPSLFNTAYNTGLFQHLQCIVPQSLYV